MTSAPNECRQKEGTRKHLRRQAEQLPLIRRHSIRRTWKTDYSSCRKVKITASAFIYRGQTHFVIRKMGKLQFGFSPPHRTRNGSAVTKVHERFRMFGRFRKFTSGILPLLNIPNLLNLLNMLNPKPFPIPHNFRAFRDGSKSRFVSAASDEPRKGETEMVAPLKAKP